MWYLSMASYIYMPNMNKSVNPFSRYCVEIEKLKINISMLLVGVSDHLKSGHTLRTSYIHMPDMNLIHHAIFEIPSGKEV